MNIKSIIGFIAFVLVFVGLNSLFIKMSNRKALTMAIILYFLNLIFPSPREGDTPE